jgi:hypothetical protein
VVAFDRKLALVRLDILGERLLDGASQEHAGIWRAAAELLPVVGERAIEQPLLEDWISAGERLVDRGIYRRYPDAHPARHIRALSQIVAGWAAMAPSGSHGTVFIGPGGVIPLWFGDALLLADVSSPQAVNWYRRSDVVEFTNRGGDSLATISAIGNGVVIRAAWKVLLLPKVASIVVDTRTPAYDGDAGGPIPAHLDRVLSGAMAALDTPEREMVTTTFRAAARASTSAPWVAGLLRCPGNLDAAVLVELMRSDQERRKERIETLLKKRVRGAGSVLELGGIPEVPRLTLRKTRRGDHGRVEDWSAIDTLAPLPDAVVELFMRSSVSPSEEGAAYLAAICAYRLGRFEESRGALARCIAIDDTVEEYWHMLAFAERHLGHYDRFERLVFAGERAL